MKTTSNQYVSSPRPSSITALIIQKRFNTTVKPLFANHPTKTLSLHLKDILDSSLPITLLPGPSDPSTATLPQQPMPKVMFGGKGMKGLECTTNPSWMEIGDRR